MRWNTFQSCVRIAAFFFLSACGDPESSPETDSGVRDGGNFAPNDAALDSGSESVIDAGPGPGTDAGSTNDAAMVDAGPNTVLDASTLLDAGPDMTDSGPNTICSVLSRRRQRWSADLSSDGNSCGFFALSIEPHVGSLDFDYRLARAEYDPPGTRDTTALIDGPLTLSGCDPVGMRADLSGEGTAPAPFLATSFSGSYQRVGTIEVLDITVRTQTATRGEVECTGRMHLE
jgi:hypothetical protein